MLNFVPRGRTVIPTPHNKSFIKSTGLPGDRIPPYHLSTLPCDGWSHRRGKVPPGKMWVEGDNEWDPNQFKDSRSYGAVPIGLIEGVVFCRLWPLFTRRQSWMVQ